jgi:hypothetical protein
MKVGAGAHFNLGTTWTIEFWLKANHASDAGINIPGGQWGLLNQHGWYYGIDSNSILIGLTAGELTIAQSNTSDVRYAEPQAGVWTHVAIVNSSGTQKVFYNGIEQTKVSGSFGGNGWTNVTDDLYIGRLAPSYSSHFDGKITNIRITDQAQYSGNFASAILPTRIVGHTRFLWTPTQYSFPSDAGDYALTIENNGVTYSTDYPTARYAFNTYPATVNEGSAASFSFRTVAVPNTTLYWEVINQTTANVDFSSASGSFVLSNSAGSFSVTASADFVTEGDESFAVTIRTGASYTGTVVATSPLVAINDTSINPTVHGSVPFNGTSQYFDIGTRVVSTTATTDSGNAAGLGTPPGVDGTYVYCANSALSVPLGAKLVADGQTCTVVEVRSVADNLIFVGLTPRITPAAIKSGDPLYFIIDQTQWNLGKTWTAEWWSKANAASGNAPKTVLCQAPGQGIDMFYYNNRLCIANNVDVCAEPTPGEWTHVAVVSNSGTVTVYYNGVSQYSGLQNLDLNYVSNRLSIGQRGYDAGGTANAFQYFNGKLTNIRITNTAVYTGAFVPDVLPLKISGTKLLWTPTNYSIVTDSSDLAETMTTHGSLAYNTDYPNEFAYEAIQVAGGILTMTKSINGLSVQAAATNFDGSPARGSYISIDGTTVASDYTIGIGQNMTRGHTMVVVNKETNVIVSINTYDTWLTPTSIEAPLAAVPAGRIVILVTYDATSCTATMRSTLVNSYGATDSTSTWTSNRRSHLFIGTKR